MRIVTVLAACAASVSVAQTLGPAQVLDQEVAACNKGECAFARSLAGLDKELATRLTDSRRSEVQEMRAYIFMRKGRPNETLAAAEASIAAHAGQMLAYQYKAHALMALGRAEEAVRAMKDGRAKAGTAKERALASCNLAGIYVQQSRWKEAVDALPPGAFVDDHAIGGCVRDVGSGFDTRGQKALAAETYRMASQSLKRDPDCRLRAMYLFTQLGRMQEAADMVSEFDRQQIEIPPGYENMYVYAVSRVKTNRAAVETMNAYLARKPNDEGGLAALGYLHNEANRYDEAAVVFGKLYRGKSRKYVEPLVGAYLAQRKFAAAKDLCESATDLEATLGKMFSLRCAEAYRHAQACDKALARYEILLKDTTDKFTTAWAAHGAGMCHEEARDYARALEKYQLAADDPRIVPRLRIVADRLKAGKTK